jgi:hypothetical protein
MTMWPRIPYAGLVLILGLTASDAHGATASAAEISDTIKAARVRLEHAITLSGEGQLDLQFAHAAFTGQATHLGRFAAIGDLNGTWTQIRGELTVHQDDILPFAITFFGLPDFRGEEPAILSFGPGSGRYAITVGFASGTVVVEDDRSFIFTFEGILREDEPPPPCFIHPCLDVH